MNEKLQFEQYETLSLDVPQRLLSILFYQTCNNWGQSFYTDRQTERQVIDTEYTVYAECMYEALNFSDGQIQIKLNPNKLEFQNSTKLGRFWPSLLVSITLWQSLI